MLNTSQHVPLRTPVSTGRLKLVSATFTTNGSNNMVGFVSSAPANNPITTSGGSGTHVLNVGRFRALRAYARLSGAQATTGVTADGEAGTITVTTALSDSFSFLFFIESFVA